MTPNRPDRVLPTDRPSRRNVREASRRRTLAHHDPQIVDLLAQRVAIETKKARRPHLVAPKTLQRQLDQRTLDLGRDRVVNPRRVIVLLVEVVADAAAEQLIQRAAGLRLTAFVPAFAEADILSPDNIPGSQQSGAQHAVFQFP